MEIRDPSMRQAFGDTGNFINAPLRQSFSRISNMPRSGVSARAPREFLLHKPTDSDAHDAISKPPPGIFSLSSLFWPRTLKMNPDAIPVP